MTICTDCGLPIKHQGLFCAAPSPHHCANDGCDAELCKSCSESYPLVIRSNVDDDPSSPEESKDELLKARIQCFCKSCFQRLSVLDFDKTYDVVDPPPDVARSGVTFVFVHGGGGSRAMFRPHARELAARYGHRGILVDLPGHGSLRDVELNLDTCWEELKSVLEDCDIIVWDQATDGKDGVNKENKKEKIVYVGGSLGAYIGFYLLQEFKDTLSSAILIDCGQNCGPGRSLKASLGLRLLSYVGKHYSNKKLAKMMLDVTKKSPADKWLIESVFGAGWFFDAARDQVELLGSIAPAQHIPELDFPILFMNGSKDHRDSEQLWLDLCNNTNSDLKVFDGGDHFFTHDSRFVEEMLKNMHDFVTVDLHW
mmetsp:Transcript_30236/g.66491  ORF Transcript_30236/g.66491 Transcript_30236/m.66491 type:complete len:368 (+) Transcript_30236:34-1137(+)